MVFAVFVVAGHAFLGGGFYDFWCYGSFAELECEFQVAERYPGIAAAADGRAGERRL